MCKARRFAAALLLGLPLALIAHAFVFGSEHAVGGTLHYAALAAGAFALALGIGLASRQATQGSILAARLRSQTPNFGVLSIAGSAWFAALESCERPHGIPILAVALALLAACALVRLTLALIARSLSAVVIALRVTSRRCALAFEYVRMRQRPARVFRSLAHTRRLFSRPPPVLS